MTDASLPCARTPNGPRGIAALMNPGPESPSFTSAMHELTHSGSGRPKAPHT